MSPFLVEYFVAAGLFPRIFMILWILASATAPRMMATVHRMRVRTIAAIDSPNARSDLLLCGGGEGVSESRLVSDLFGKYRVCLGVPPRAWVDKCRVVHGRGCHFESATMV